MQSTRQKGAVFSGPGSASEISKDSALCHGGNNMFVHCLRISDTIGSITEVAQSRAGINPFCWLSPRWVADRNTHFFVGLRPDIKV